MSSSIHGLPIEPIARELWFENEHLAFTALHHPFVRALADGSLSK